MADVVRELSVGYGNRFKGSLRPVLAVVLITAVQSATPSHEFYYGHFPDGFIWSASSAAYQLEGGWNVDGKGPSIWDEFVHQPGHIADNATGDVACDSYHKYREDIALLKKLGVTHYRFSLSWPRLIPDPVLGTPNPAGIAFYHAVIDGLLGAGIQPIVTLYHWDLPQSLQAKYQGWINPAIADYFLQYADLCFRLYGEKVKWWITINEPVSVIQGGLGSAAKAPGWDKPAYLPYHAGRVLLLAHAKAWHLYNNTYRTTQQGKVGMCFGTWWMEPKNRSNPADVAAAERAEQFSVGWFAHPIYGGGDYPAVMKEYVIRKSREQGLNGSRLPDLTATEIQFINGTFDLFGLNHYTSRLIEFRDTGTSNPGYQGDQDTAASVDPAWPKTGLDWLYVVPWGFRKIVNWVSNEYGHVPILITENGYPDHTGKLEDDDRIDYYKAYLNELLKASKLDNCTVLGYSTWSLMDNFEWANGYTAKFGLHYVNFSDPARPRTPKKSASYFSDIVRNNGFPNPNVSL